MASNVDFGRMLELRYNKKLWQHYPAMLTTFEAIQGERNHGAFDEATTSEWKEGSSRRSRHEEFFFLIRNMYGANYLSSLEVKLVDDDEDSYVTIWSGQGWTWWRPGPWWPRYEAFVAKLRARGHELRGENAQRALLEEKDREDKARALVAAYAARVERVG